MGGSLLHRSSVTNTHLSRRQPGAAGKQRCRVADTVGQPEWGEWSPVGRLTVCRADNNQKNTRTHDATHRLDLHWPVPRRAGILQPGGGGIGGTGKVERYEGLIVGVVDRAGGFVLNGDRFDTDGATVYVDGAEGSLDDIRAGMKVLAKAAYPQASVSAIHYQPSVSGPIEAVRRDGSAFEVFGNTVLIDEQTVLDELFHSELANGLFVEVSGDRNSRDEIVARYVRKSANVQSVYAVGTAEFSEDDMTWRVGGKVIDFSAAAQSIGLSTEEFASYFLMPGASVRISATDQQRVPAEGVTCSDFTVDANSDTGNQATSVLLSQSTCNSEENPSTDTPEGQNGSDGVDGESAVNGNGGDGSDGGDAVNGNGGNGGDGGDAVNGNGGDGGDGGDAVSGNGGDGGDGGDGSTGVSSQSGPAIGLALAPEIVVLSVAKASAPDLSPGDYVQISSTVSRVNGPLRFVVDGFNVTITEETQIHNAFGLPSDRFGVTLDQRVQVEGVAGLLGMEITAQTVRLLDVLQ